MTENAFDNTEDKYANSEENAEFDYKGNIKNLASLQTMKPTKEMKPKVYPALLIKFYPKTYQNTAMIWMNQTLPISCMSVGNAGQGIDGRNIC